MKIPRSIERFARAAGAVVLAGIAPIAPELWTQGMAAMEGISPAWAVILAPVINGMMKEIRLRFPENKVLKALPI